MLIIPSATYVDRKGTAGDKRDSSKTEERGAEGLLDSFRGRYDKLDIHLDQPEYQNINPLAAAKMLGHFVQTMQNQGYPWKLYEATADGKAGYRKGELLSDKDAFLKLQKGEPLLMQPMRDLQLDLSSGSLGAVAAAGTLAGRPLNGLGTVAEASKNTQISAGNQGFTIKHGEPIVINSVAELKLLNQLYNSEQKLESKDPITQAAHQLSYFTQKTLGSNYPWRFYTKDDGNAALRMTKSTIKGVATGAALGAAVTGVLGLGAALFARDISYLYGALGVGAAVGGAGGGYNALQTSRKGNPINAVEALERIVSGKEVVFQETRARTTPLPLVSKMSWFFDQGKGSSISSVDELNTFFYMQSGAELPKPEEKKPEPTPTVVLLDQSVHNHYQTNQVGVFPQGQ